jgi:hypothetical protein
MRASRLVPGALVLLGAVPSSAILSACKSNADPKPAEQALSLAGDDDSAEEEEMGQEGEDGALAVRGSGAACTGSAALLAEVDRIVNRARASTYSHTTRVDEAAARYDLDCSGLVDYALARVCPDVFATLRAASTQRPLAKHFVAFLGGLQPGETRGRWRRVEKAAALSPGDVVAWLKPSDVTSKNTGHVMVVRAPVSANRGEVTVPIIDSTSVRHGTDDTRSAAKTTGVGAGTIHLLVDEAGAASGYRWSNGKKARNHATTVALGRVE